MGIAALTVLLTPAFSNANPTAPPRSISRGAHPAGVQRPRFRRAAGGPTTCSTSNATSFVGISGQSDVAGLYSAVAGGMSNEACDEESVIGGGNTNVIGAAGQAPQSFIGAGDSNGITGASAFIGAGQSNAAQNDETFVGAGYNNVASGVAAFVGGGDYAYFNAQEENDALPTIGNQASGFDSFVGAGDLNVVSGYGSFIGAGGYSYALTFATTPGNQIAGTDSFIGSGDRNNVAASEAFVGGGQNNSIAAQATNAAIAGGSMNSITGDFGTIAGGNHNSATATAAAVGGGSSSSATGPYATIPGGYLNAANGTGSFAAGTQAKARQNGAFVWSDNAGPAAVQSTAAYQFVARASGGFFLFTNAAQTSGARLNPGSGTWASQSDRAMKTGVVALDDSAVLAKVAALPVSEWSYTSERGVRHVGPMAQDFYAAFRVGEDDRHITSIDEDGVALAAIKALVAENRRLHVRLARDDARLGQDDARLGRYDSRFAAIERKLETLELAVARSR